MKSSDNVRYFLSILFKHKYRILGVLLATIVTVTIGTLFISPVYESTSTLLVTFGREYVYQPEVGNRGPTKYFNREGIINTEIEIFFSRDLHEKLINSLGIKKLYPQLVEDPPPNTSLLQAAEQKFDENLTVLGSKDSNIIRVSFQHANPNTASSAVNLLVDLFQEKHLQTFSNPKAATFLEEKVDNYRARIAVLEEKVDAFKQKNLTTSIKDQEKLYLDQRAKLSVSFKETLSQIAALQERLTSLESQIQSIPESITHYTETRKNDVIDQAKEELLSLQMKERELQQKLGEKNPKLISLRHKIALVDTFLKEQEEGVKGNVRIGKNEVYLEIEKDIIQAKADLRSQEAKKGILAKQLKELDEEIRTLTLPERELRNITNELETTRQNYQTYRKKLEEIQISSEMDRQKMTNIRVVQAATVPVNPIKPNMRINLAIGVFLGTFAGLSLAFLHEYFKQGFNSKERVEKYLGLPVLETIRLKEQINQGFNAKDRV